MHGQDVLIVDDDKDFVEVMGLKLRKSGFNVKMAYDGKRGYEIATRDKPDLIILDIRMPVKDGISTVEDLLQTASTMFIPVIVVTAFDDKMKKKRAEQLGAVAYLTKPLDEKKFIRVVHNILGG